MPRWTKPTVATGQGICLGGYYHEHTPSYEPTELLRLCARGAGQGPILVQFITPVVRALILNPDLEHRMAPRGARKIDQWRIRRELQLPAKRRTADAAGRQQRTKNVLNDRTGLVGR